jgi:hypothetical protein
LLCVYQRSDCVATTHIYSFHTYLSVMKYAIQLYHSSGFGRIVHPLLIGCAGWRSGISIVSCGVRSKKGGTADRLQNANDVRLFVMRTLD